LFIGGDINISLDESSDSLWDWKEIQEKAREANNMKTYVTNDEASH
jgi:hypothetical protein